jgi:DNA-damage-inducible protein D
MTDDEQSLFDIANPVFEESYHSNGQIYWYASDFVLWLGYKEYSPAMSPVNKAISVCMSTNLATADHFREEWRMINGRQMKDYRLSRFACYLIAMNSDIKKTPVAKAQAYFAAFTAQIHEYIQNQGDIERIALRKEISEHEKSLSSAAKQAGITDYAYFANKGYMGLYNMPIHKIRELKGVPAGATPLDYMGAEELGANIFRITQTDAKIKRENIRGQDDLEQAAFQVGRTVRKAIAENGGTMPEELPPHVHVAKIKSELKKTSKEYNKTDKKLIEKKNEKSGGRPKNDDDDKE